MLEWVDTRWGVLFLGIILGMVLSRILPAWK